ncbi:hypothetical protein OPT61_g9212 [Boeremia exigua]|uniref:Uncharacterized protein n=1 Tax=Boeremia exigua TaxID=749465 RepID=A0ACC2HV26_9PLEO|nr:hypothetical protein OPT61_g9212 [Boeremia exigua]
MQNPTKIQPFARIQVDEFTFTTTPERFTPIQLHRDDNEEVGEVELSLNEHGKDGEQPYVAHSTAIDIVQVRRYAQNITIG